MEQNRIGRSVKVTPEEDEGSDKFLWQQRMSQGLDRFLTC